ncbi:MAG: UDP-3-O-(3-hydroxymyristoyl)glucosamine N-acyltransferase [Phycisphaeraceae bacterium]
MTAQTTQDIAEWIDGRLEGDGTIRIEGLAALDQAKGGELTFIGDEAYAARWTQSRAAAALVADGVSLEPGQGRALIFVDNADLAMARLLDRLSPPEPMPQPGVHRSADIADGVALPEDARIGANVVVQPGVRLGAACVLHPGVFLGEGVTIGDHAVLHPHVVVRHGCTLGDRCILHAGCVIGGDGFGYRPEPTPDGPPRILKIPHLGAVTIGNDVEIGANACIDRGKFADTRIGNQCKIDNLVQIGHNCVIGDMVLIAGASGIAGSVTIGAGAMIGGMVACKDHVTIGAGARIAGGAQIAGNVPDGAAYAGSPARPIGEAKREVFALKKLPEALKRIPRA